jgi:hypothetical protein
VYAAMMPLPEQRRNTMNKKSALSLTTLTTSASATPIATAGAVSKAFPTRLTPVPTGLAANSPAYVHAGRKPGTKTNSRNIVLLTLKAFAIELQVPLRSITKYDPAHWAQVSSKVTPAVLERVYRRLASTLPHPGFGVAANAGPDLRYFAGFTDGDGCISTVRYHPKHHRFTGYRPRFQIVCNDPGVLQDAHAVMGANGKIYQTRRNLAVNRQTWNLIYDGVHALHALCGIAPYLRIKGPQALALLAYWFLGRQWVNPGPRGTPPVIRKVRRTWHRRIQAMK